MDDKSLFKGILGVKTEKTEEDEHFEEEVKDTSDCPYGKCNGTGIMESKLDSRDVSFCQCYKDRVLEQKLKNSNINTNFSKKSFDDFDEETKVKLFKPKLKPGELKKNTRVKSEVDETPLNFVKRSYDIVTPKRTLKEILESYSDKNVDLLEAEESTANLLMFGDPGNGKTSFAVLVGMEFLKRNRTVHFATTQDFLDAIYDKENNPKDIARKVDVLILDELFNEYHTDTKFAKKQLKEIFKMREELGLITICTSNGTPRDFNLLYGESMMSLLNGTFIMFMLERETDKRVENIHNMYGDFGL